MKNGMQPNLKEWVLYSMFGAAGALIVHFATGIGWGFSAFASFVGWPLLGTLVTADDDLPGGWSNPDGTEPPPWRTAIFYGQVCTGVAVSAFVAGVEAGIRTSLGIGFFVGGLAAALMAVLLSRSHVR